MIRVFPLVQRTWSESGDQQPEQTGVPEEKGHVMSGDEHEMSGDVM